MIKFSCRGSFHLCVSKMCFYIQEHIMTIIAVMICRQNLYRTYDFTKFENKLEVEMSFPNPAVIPQHREFKGMFCGSTKKYIVLLFLNFNTLPVFSLCEQTIKQSGFYDKNTFLFSSYLPSDLTAQLGSESLWVLSDSSFPDD